MRIWLILVVCCLANSMANAGQPAMTDGPTVACLKEANFERYLELLNDDISAAIAYYMDHGCVMLKPKTFVRVDQGSTLTKSNHVCIRPTGSYDCL